VTFLESPYDWLFAHKIWIFAILIGGSVIGLAIDHFSGKNRHPHETFSNLAIFIGNNSMNLFLAQALQLAAFTWIASFVPWKIPTNGWTLATAFLLVDFCYYWRHRWEHEVHLLWCEHSVHHSSEEYNFSTSLRLPVINPLFGWVFFVPLALLGFPAKLVLAGFFLNLLYQYWIHNHDIRKLPVLDRFLSTPSNHRVHHARNPRYLDKNYGGVFIVWDHLFGTYEPETETTEFGIVTPIGTRNPILVNTRPFVRMYEKMRKQNTTRRKLTAIFGAPGALE
jgi:sterol desaturase/sphingolipid hydroxylase (fatty acid hydroxylase superfamily)